MRCCKSAPDNTNNPLAAVLQYVLTTLTLCFALCVAAAEMEIRSASLVPGEDSYVLNADFGVELSTRLEDVVSHGVPLYIVAEFDLTRARWYWFDEQLASKTLIFRLSYHALTRQYRLSTGALHQSFATLDDALRILSRVRDWPVAEKTALQPGENYQAALRVHVDLTQLPKPLQVTAIGSKEWNLGSEWLRWTYTVPTEREAK